MNVRGRKGPQSMKAPVKNENVKEEIHETKKANAAIATPSGRASSRERKMAIQKDVDKLKKKLRHEENVHRALQRAFNRPLGALPRLPPFLPPNMLELLAEVAVLEEEVVRLEEQVVHFRQDLYQEAVYMSSSMKNMESSSDLHQSYPKNNSKSEKSKQLAPNVVNSKINTRRHSWSLSDDGLGKENYKGLSNQKPQTIRTEVKIPSSDSRAAEKHSSTQKLQLEWRLINQGVEARKPFIQEEKLSGDDNPNKISENILKCLSTVLLRRYSSVNELTEKEKEIRDPYGICSEFGTRDIGPYKHLCAIETGVTYPKRAGNSLFLVRRSKLLLEKLASAKLQRLTHQEKLAFWINIYNSCVINAFLEHGIPETPEMVVALMQKATILVGGHLLNAITIEHFILRLPYHSQYTFAKSGKDDEKSIRSVFGLELSEPLVTFALSCGSWSSPAVRVYTASKVENELEMAKREYLQAAVGISSMRFGIPKLLDWYLLDFAKDLESLLDWVCLQLPDDLRKDAIKCLERGKSDPFSQFVKVMPYEFSFRYLLCT